MKKIPTCMLTFALLIPILFAVEFVSAREPVKVIFDTDMGNDVDDAMALAVVHALQTRGELELLAVTTTKDNKFAAPMIDVLNTFYGRPDIPVGVCRSKVTPDDGRYNAQVVGLKDADGKALFPHKITPETELLDAVPLLRKTLAGQEDGSVVIVQIGFFTNLCQLLDTKGDDHSPLDGMELVRKKVRYASIMAGAFDKGYANHREYNVVCDLPSARKMIEHWPTEVIFSGFEIGDWIKHPSVSMREDFEYVAAHPVKEAYRFYRGLENDQPTFDINSVLQVARPSRGYFTLSEPGTVRFTEEGLTVFKADPNGKHRYQKVDQTQIAVVREAIVQLTAEPPKGKF